MNKKLIEKLKDIFKKDGFYIALFLCLCILATLGTISYKMIDKNNVNNLENKVKNESALNVDQNKQDKLADNTMQNAERVEKDSINKTDVSDNTEGTESKKETVVGNTAAITFVNPVEGIESRTYTYPKPVQIEENLFRNIKGVNIESKLGTDVKAAAEGIVSLVENSGVEEGMVVEIKHANGLKTRYANLDENVSVKEGQKVNSGAVIGKIGNTAKVFDQKKFGQFLNLQVIDANGNQVNPENYFKLSCK